MRVRECEVGYRIGSHSFETSVDLRNRNTLDVKGDVRGGCDGG